MKIISGGQDDYRFGTEIVKGTIVASTTAAGAAAGTALGCLAGPAGCAAGAATGATVGGVIGGEVAQYAAEPVRDGIAYSINENLRSHYDSTQYGTFGGDGSY
ncbi:hypothetical protein [Candidatus Hamiltonella defensa]|uniref:hypothetical protein n=1 Tax=Candidatus Williamhamiltonella defendens TaxID=138072 RepID=UPI0013DF597B